MDKSKVDYSLYLVTDSTGSILGDRSLVDVVRSAVEGGRDKTSETAGLVSTAKRLHEVTKKHNIPLLINDRVDVALATGVEGVHIGQEDLDLASARRILGPDAIIGVTASSIQEAQTAAEAGADYLGIGTVYPTSTKENTKSIIGIAGLREIIDSLPRTDRALRTVCIGGINGTNTHRVISKVPQLDGVAIVSAIIGASNPQDVASTLRSAIRDAREVVPASSASGHFSIAQAKEGAPQIVKELGDRNPLCHNMTNLVVQNFAANVALCIGASPIMSNNGDEAPDLAKLGGALVINMGTSTPDMVLNYKKALQAYNAVGGPVLYDPVGAGATESRRKTVKHLLESGTFNIIKGNEGEIKAVAGASGLRQDGIGGGAQQRGVDSGASTLDNTGKAKLVKALASRESVNVVIMTGKTDFVSDGKRVLAISNGHEYLGAITGSGCTLGTTIAAFAAGHREDYLLAAVTGILMYEIAAEIAAKREDVKGPGTFVPAFLDTLYKIRKDAAEGKNEWIQAVKIVEIDI
ncbi:MAG: hypothetical protein M1820_010055 [Bogoriella megaspora]|nr:MAG: hypothetical protein M1820_010055 [Bogoriella megaspora]